MNNKATGGYRESAYVIPDVPTPDVPIPDYVLARLKAGCVLRWVRNSDGERWYVDGVECLPS